MNRQHGCRYRNFVDAFVLLSAVSLAAMMGCERQEKVIDVETPIGDVEVNRNVDDDSVEVEVDGNRRSE